MGSGLFGCNSLVGVLIWPKVSSIRPFLQQGLLGPRVLRFGLRARWVWALFSILFFCFLFFCMLFFKFLSFCFPSPFFPSVFYPFVCFSILFVCLLFCFVFYSLVLLSVLWAPLSIGEGAPFLIQCHLNTTRAGA